MDATRNLDRAATALSLACVAHCIALPAMAIALPFLSGAAEAEWVHWLLTVLAICASGTVAATAQNARTMSFLLPASIGVVFITGALFAETFGVDETPLTLIGGVLIAAAHMYRIYRTP